MSLNMSRRAIKILLGLALWGYLRLTLDKASWSTGETVTASSVRLVNAGSSSGNIEIKFWLAPPS